MTVPVQEHAFDPATEVCVYCHVPKRNVAAGPITCIYRWADAVARADRPQVSAVDDFDFIGARLAQLRAEREAAAAEKKDDEPIDSVVAMGDLRIYQIIYLPAAAAVLIDEGVLTPTEAHHALSIVRD